MNETFLLVVLPSKYTSASKMKIKLDVRKTLLFNDSKERGFTSHFNYLTYVTNKTRDPRGKQTKQCLSSPCDKQ